MKRSKMKKMKTSMLEYLVVDCQLVVAMTVVLGVLMVVLVQLCIEF